MNRYILTAALALAVGVGATALWKNIGSKDNILKPRRNVISATFTLEDIQALTDGSPLLLCEGCRYRGVIFVIKESTVQDGIRKPEQIVAYRAYERNGEAVFTSVMYIPDGGDVTNTQNFRLVDLSRPIQGRDPSLTFEEGVIDTLADIVFFCPDALKRLAEFQGNNDSPRGVKVESFVYDDRDKENRAFKGQSLRASALSATSIQNNTTPSTQQFVDGIPCPPIWNNSNFIRQTLSCPLDLPFLVAMHKGFILQVKPVVQNPFSYIPMYQDSTVNKTLK
jgi:hypothetical protein